MVSLDPARTALVAIDMHRGHLDPKVATLPLAAERCDPVIERAAQLFAALRARRIPIVHVVTEYRDAHEILPNPFWKAIHDDPTRARKRMSGHNRVGEPTTEIIPDLLRPEDWIVRGKRYNPFHDTDPRVPTGAPAAGEHADPRRDQHDFLRAVLRLRGDEPGLPRRHRCGCSLVDGW